MDVEGIGRVITAVCKDLVSDARRPIDLARDLGGDILLAPTMSDSLDRGFGIQLKLLSARNLAVGCVCNLCSFSEAHGNDDDEVVVSLVSIPAGGNPHPKQAEPESMKVRVCLIILVPLLLAVTLAIPKQYNVSDLSARATAEGGSTREDFIGVGEITFATDKGYARTYTDSGHADTDTFCVGGEQVAHAKGYWGYKRVYEGDHRVPMGMGGRL